MSEQHGDNGGLSRLVVVANPLGLHARPAHKLVELAQGFDCDIVLRMDDQEVDAKSILDILTLAAAQGSKLSVVATGHDAAPALDSIEQLFENRFGEE